jgi:Cu/Ag efflux protein CusF
MNYHRLFLSIAALCSFVATACQTSAPEKHYPIQAEVISSEPQHQILIVKHGDIPGLMPAMTMSYMVANPKQIESLKSGDKITADLVVSDNKGRLEKITLVAKSAGHTPSNPVK